MQPRHGLDRHLDAEIATGDHQRIRQFDDLVDALDRLGFLDFRHQPDARTCDLAHIRKILGPLNE